MRPHQRIQRPLQVQARFSLCPSPSFLGVLLGVDRSYSGQWEGHPERAMSISPAQTPVLDVDAHGALGTMGCLGVGDSNELGCRELATLSRRWGDASERGQNP